MASGRGKSVVSPAALEDLRLQSAWYFDQASEDVAERYLQAFDNILLRLERNPLSGSKCRFRNKLLVDLRSLGFGGRFRVHRIFYRVDGETIDVLRVMHGARDLPRRLIEPPGAED